jgi:16S rRNA (cytosine967-C5)-methyltransferase
LAGSVSGSRIRAEAARALDEVVTGGKSLDTALAHAEQEMEGADRALLRMLCYGCLRYHFRLRAQLALLLDRPLRKRDSVIESLLVVGLYQLSDLRVPDHAAVSMTVQAARTLRRPKYAGLVNAVLRNFVRRKIAGQPPPGEEALYNHPAWLIGRLRQDWPDDWESIITANNARAPMWLRVNRLRCTAADYVERLGETQAAAGELARFADHAVRLAAPVPVDTLPGFRDGDVSVQDAAAQLAAPWLLAAGGGRVLDACAAPGGKTGQLLELLGPDAEVVALDADPDRATRIGENLGRLGLDATLIVADASDLNEWWDGRPFDRILLDAPCSATGVIRRHPDIKVLRREADIGALADTQRSILEALWPALKPGGRLLYVTCSVLAAENEAVVEPFLRGHRDADEDRVLQDYNIRDLMRERRAGFQVLPGTAGMDGFYFAAIDKAASAE